MDLRIPSNQFLTVIPELYRSISTYIVVCSFLKSNEENSALGPVIPLFWSIFPRSKLAKSHPSLADPRHPQPLCEFHSTARGMHLQIELWIFYVTWNIPLIPAEFPFKSPPSAIYFANRIKTRKYLIRNTNRRLVQPEWNLWQIETGSINNQIANSSAIVTWRKYLGFCHSRPEPTMKQRHVTDGDNANYFHFIRAGEIYGGISAAAHIVCYRIRVKKSSFSAVALGDETCCDVVHQTEKCFSRQRRH